MNSVYIATQIFFASIAWLLSKVWFSIDVRGAENILGKNGPLILVANHKSLIDHFLILSSIPHFWRSSLVPIIIMTHDRHFRSFPTKTFFKALGTYPAKRGEGYDISLAKPIEVLKKSGTVGLYPEGRTIPGKELGDFKRGIGELILRARGISVIPIAIHAPNKMMFDVLPYIGSRASVAFGREFYPDLSLTSEAITADIKERISSLFYQ